jgi:hypothetical protein
MDFFVSAPAPPTAGTAPPEWEQDHRASSAHLLAETRVDNGDEVKRSKEIMPSMTRQMEEKKNFDSPSAKIK